MGQSRPLFVYFCYFLETISIIQIEKKRRWCAWDSNLQPHDGRRRLYHGAMSAALNLFSLAGPKVGKIATSQLDVTIDAGAELGNSSKVKEITEKGSREQTARERERERGSDREMTHTQRRRETNGKE